ncbi:uncharacterized protein LOC143915433 isoform X1 [Arctopsyche grandis]|uniref:uncharacterized protein LOC143915433 isoform X1 n=1 Tax=Arctopsyche grandis TaxID=121162 RepID=UPI00406D80B3
MEDPTYYNEPSSRDSDTESPADNLSNSDAKLLRKFIENYETLPLLWDQTHPDYCNKFKRNAALGKLLRIYIRLKPGATVIDVKRKINSLRSNYRKELKKIIASKSSGDSPDDVYSPTSWTFYALNFLDKIEQPENSHQNNQYRLVEIAYEDYDVSKLKAERTTSLSSIQQREKHFSEPPRKKKRLLGTISQQTELLQKACSFLESSEKPEENPIIVKLWYEKLQNLDPLQRLYAEKAINDILFEASLGTLERNSVKINE